jgi:hypothetical protein
VQGSSSAAVQPLGDRMELAAVAEVPGLEVVRVDAAARKWTWFHETCQSHLTRHFTRTLGVSPGRYRQAVR